jgi:hypothetical protein
MNSVVTRTSLTLAWCGLCVLGSSGTAWAGVPGSSGVASAGYTIDSQLQAPPPPPHRFRAKYNTLAQCQTQARREHPNRPSDWDCRRGPDRNNPWEYWGI